jgi:hypothetical protein
MKMLKFVRTKNPNVLVQEGITDCPYEIRHYGSLVGKTVKEVRLQRYYEGSNLAILEFTDGSSAAVFCDPEGNGPGWLDIQE